MAGKLVVLQKFENKANYSPSVIFLNVTVLRMCV